MGSIGGARGDQFRMRNPDSPAPSGTHRLAWWTAPPLPSPMLDIRRLRTDPDAVRAGLSRRGGEAADSVDELVAADAQQRAARHAAGRDPRARIKALSKDVGRSAAAGDTAAPRRSWPRAGRSATRRRRSTPRPRRWPRRSSDLLLRTPNVPSADAPDGAGEADNVVLRTEGYDAAAYGEHQRVPHWDIGAELGILDPERAVKISGSMFTMYKGWGARLLRGARAAEPRPQRRRLRGGAAAHPRAHRDDGRPPATSRSSTTTAYHDRARRPLGHPHRRGAAHVAAPRRGARRGRPARCATWPTRRASAARPARPAATPAACCAATSSTRSSCSRWPAAPSRPSPARRTCSPAASRSSATSASPTASLDLCTGDLGASAARTWDIEAYAPGLRPVARGQLGVVVRRLPGPPGRHPLPAARRQGHRGSCHTVNGSAMGWPRTVAAYLETHRQPDGSIADRRVPAPLPRRRHDRRLIANRGLQRGLAHDRPVRRSLDEALLGQPRPRPRRPARPCRCRSRRSTRSGPRW